MKLIALVNFSPDGYRRIKSGQPFDMPESAARLLIALKKAKAADDTSAPTKGRYRRRDLRAED